MGFSDNTQLLRFVANDEGNIMRRRALHTGDNVGDDRWTVDRTSVSINLLGITKSRDTLAGRLNISHPPTLAPFGKLLLDRDTEKVVFLTRAHNRKKRLPLSRLPHIDGCLAIGPNRDGEARAFLGMRACLVEPFGDVTQEPEALR